MVYPLLVATAALRTAGRRGRLRLLVGQLAAMTAEQTRRRKLTELVTNHVFRDIHGNELVAVVHSQRVTNELGRDGGRTRPRLEDFLLASRVHVANLVLQLRVDERALLQ